MSSVAKAIFCGKVILKITPLQKIAKKSGHPSTGTTTATSYLPVSTPQAPQRPSSASLAVQRDRGGVIGRAPQVRCQCGPLALLYDPPGDPGYTTVYYRPLCML